MYVCIKLLYAQYLHMYIHMCIRTMGSLRPYEIVSTRKDRKEVCNQNYEPNVHMHALPTETGTWVGDSDMQVDHSNMLAPTRFVAINNNIYFLQRLIFCEMHIPQT